MILAFLLTIIQIKDVTWEVIPAGWPFYAVILAVLLVIKAKNGELGAKVPTPLLICGLALLGYATLSLSWALATALGIFELVQLYCLAIAFTYGAMQRNLRKVAIGLAIGLTISSLMTIPQHFGYQLVGEWRPERPSGLLWNPVVLGEAIALIIVLLATYREWWYIPALLPGLWYCQSRGAWLALAVVAFARITPWTLLALPPLGAAFWFLPTYSDTQRMDIWEMVYKHLTFFGKGVGSLYSPVFVIHNIPYKPAFAHNEFLDFIYLYGVGGIAGCLLLLAPLSIRRPERWAYYCFFIMALYSFPLHDPVLVFISGVIAGCICQDWTNPFKGVSYGTLASFRAALPLRRGLRRTERVGV